jgi:hypothetical protein
MHIRSTVLHGRFISLNPAYRQAILVLHICFTSKFGVMPDD